MVKFRKNKDSILYKIFNLSLAILLVFLYPITSKAAYVIESSYLDYNDTHRFEIEMEGSSPAEYYKIWLDGSLHYSSLGLNPLSAETYTTNCNGVYNFKFYDENHNIVGNSEGQTFNVTTIQNPSSSCGGDSGGGTTDPPEEPTDPPPPDTGGGDSGDPEPPSDGTDPPDDGGTTEPPEDDGSGYNDPCEGYVGEINPDCPDNGDTGGTTDPPDDGTGGSTDPPDDGSGGSTDPPTTEPCPDCAVFECPGWNEYMGKMDEIIAKLDWEVMSETWYQTVAPRLVSDFETMLGSAPDPAPTPPQPAPIESNGFENIRPDITENPELGTSGFTLTDLETEAPVIEFREDPTGGFNLVDPVNALPDLPTDDFPIPGQTNAGEWENNKPTEQDISFPIPSGQDTQPDTSTAPIPSQSEDPIPIPEDDQSNAPVPSATPIIGTTQYKTHPDNPDGI